MSKCDNQVILLILRAKLKLILLNNTEILKRNTYLVIGIFFLTMLCCNSSFSQTINTVKFTTAKNLPFGLSGMASATDQKRIYIKGGSTSFNHYSSGLYAYDIELNEWMDLSKSINLKATQFGKGIFLPEYNTIAFIGGITPVNNSIRIIPSIIGFDLETYRFSSLGNSPLISKLLGAAYWEGKVYMFGGSISSESHFSHHDQKYTNKMYSYSPENGGIESLPDHPEAKEMKGEVMNGLLYTFGGNDNLPNKNIHTYTIESKVWQKIASFENSVSAYALVKYKHYFLLIGDYSNKNQMIVFDTNTNTWEVYQMNFGVYHMGAVIAKNMLHVFGGDENSQASRQHWVLNLETFLKE